MRFSLVFVFLFGFSSAHGLEESDTVWARQHYERGEVLLDNAQYDSAITCFFIALNSFKDSDLRWTLRTKNKLAKAHYKINRFGDSRHMCEEVIKSAIPLSGSKNLLLADSYNELGNIHRASEVFDSAIWCHSRSYALRVDILGEYNPIVAGSLNNLGLTYKSMGDYEKALEFMTQALHISELAKDSLNQAGYLNNMGNVFQKMGDYYAAVDCYSTSLKIYDQIISLQHPSRAFCLNNLGNAYGSLGQFELSLRYRNQAFEMKKASYK